MVRLRGNRFQADVMIAGVRYRQSFGTREEAEDYERSLRFKKTANRKLGFQDFYRTHFDYLWGDNKAPEATRTCLEMLDRYIKPKTRLAEIDRVFVFDLVTRMKADGVSNSTINRRLSALSKVLRHAENLEITRRPHIPFLKEPHGRERTLSDREEDKMVRFFEHMGLDWAKALTTFLLYSGCRTGEAYELTRDSVESGYIHFGYAITKTKKSRVVPLVEPAAEAWAFMCAASGKPKPLDDYSRNTFRGHWNLLRIHMGLQDDDEFVPHMLRHTCASRLVSRGIPLPKVMLWMGHDCIQTTLRYSHLVPHDLDEAAAVLTSRPPSAMDRRRRDPRHR